MQALATVVVSLSLSASVILRDVGVNLATSGKLNVLSAQAEEL